MIIIITLYINCRKVRNVFSLCLKGKSEMSTEIFGSDPLRTLGEILAYCQVTEPCFLLLPEL